ncbi:MAG: YqbH/XkdH family protein [Ruminococcus sp.]|nr:YqbH/XkdH family protein [Ruminococcus sp.]MCD7810370.1 YqbH/XkdH family protein [Ruminococcus sp.]
MSIENFFDHKCDIYHIAEESRSPGYSLPDSPAFSYPDEPDEADIPCHFAVKSFSHTMQQTQPANELEAKIKLTLPADTDVRRNDKIVELSTGLEFTAMQPRNVRGHHLFVFIQRTDAQKPL